MARAAEKYQLDSRLIDRAESGRVLPGADGQWRGALYTSSDGRAEPQQAVPALARRAHTAGATIVAGCAIRGIETRGGRVSSAVTERGVIACSAVVLAGGAWSRLFCQNIGLTLPQLKVRASVMRVDGVSGAAENAALGVGFAFRKRADGGYTVANSTGSIADVVPDSFRFFRKFLPLLAAEWRETPLRFGHRFFEEWRQPTRWTPDEESPFECARILDPQPSGNQLDKGLRNLRAAFPAFATAKIRQSWAGYIDATPDAVPVISGVESLPGFFIATGFSGHGFGIGPGAGRLMADLVAGNAPIVDPTPFRFSASRMGRRSRSTQGFEPCSTGAHRRAGSLQRYLSPSPAPAARAAG